MTDSKDNSIEICQWIFYWNEEIGVNVIPADTKNKKPIVSWKEFQNQSIQKSQLEQWKSESKFVNGFAVILGKIWNGKNKGLYLNGIDCDNKKAITEICNALGFKDTDELANWTVVEQHRDDPTKAHIYILSRHPFKKKSSSAVNPKFAEMIDSDEIPAIEVKGLGEHGILYCSPSIHKNGHPYEILGTKNPVLYDEFESKLYEIFQKYNSSYLNSNDDDSMHSDLIPINELFKKDFVIFQGHNRHEALLRTMESLIKRNKEILEFKDLRELAKSWNQKHCKPPLDDTEFEKQWNDAIKFIMKNAKNNKKNSDKINSNILNRVKKTHSNPKENQKSQFKVYKYSQLGRGDLHESCFVSDKPCFLKYNSVLKEIELVSNIEENSWILLPQEKEDYPYTPYSFDSKDDLAKYNQMAKETTIDKLYEKVKSIFTRYIDQDPHVISLLTAGCIFTYFQDIFPVTHYTEGVGDNDVGKSSIGYTFAGIGYRVIRATAISGANYYRMLGSIEPGQCVIIEDEGDGISEDQDKIRILKSGYEYSGKVPKINMNSQNQIQIWFNTYCYKMILAEKSLSQSKAKGLVDRIFSFHCRPGSVHYSIKEVVSATINKDMTLKKLYDELQDIKKLMLCYRLIHYKDELPRIKTGLINREHELCKPLLQLFYGTESLKEIVNTFEIFVKQKRDKKSSSMEAVLFPIISKFAKKSGNSSTVSSSKKIINSLREENIVNFIPQIIRISYSDIWEEIIKGEVEGYYNELEPQKYDTVNYGTWYRNTLSKIIADKFGGKLDRKTKGSIIEFNRDELDRFEQVYGNQIKDIKIEVKLEENSYSSIDIVERHDGYDGYEGSAVCC